MLKESDLMECLTMMLSLYPKNMRAIDPFGYKMFDDKTIVAVEFVRGKLKNHKASDNGGAS